MEKNNNQAVNDDLYEIDIKHVFSIFYKKKILILSFTLLSLFFSIIYAYLIPDLYKSSAILIPSSSEDSLSSKLSSYSPLAGLAGLGVASDEISKSQEALERMKSFEFFSQHFLPFIKLENLLAVNDWDYKKNILTYDKSIFDNKLKEWVRKADYPKGKKPSEQEAYKTYSKIINIYEDNKTSLVSISIEHQSPIIAKRWLDIIIENINESMREEDRQTAINSINYLNESSQSTNIQSLKDAIANLQETQMQTLMLTSSNKNYIFKTIDSPLISEEKFKPKRLLISIFGIFFGFLLGLTIVVVNHFFSAKTKI
tara:strand:+ start:139 stop:1077 length:939 start_codon:yes stop_codon:yes gene_type:complete